MEESPSASPPRTQPQDTPGARARPAVRSHLCSPSGPSHALPPSVPCCPPAPALPALSPGWLRAGRGAPAPAAMPGNPAATLPPEQLQPRAPPLEGPSPQQPDSRLQPSALASALSPWGSCCLGLRQASRCLHWQSGADVCAHLRLAGLNVPPVLRKGTKRVQARTCPRLVCTPRPPWPAAASPGASPTPCPRAPEPSSAYPGSISPLRTG